MKERFPAIVAEANSVGAKIYFEDESGISLNIFSGGHGRRGDRLL